MNNEACRKAREAKAIEYLQDHRYHRYGNLMNQPSFLDGMEYAYNLKQPVLTVEEMVKIMCYNHKKHWSGSRISVAPIGGYAQAIKLAYDEKEKQL